MREFTLYETVEMDRKLKNLNIDEYCKQADISINTYYRMKNISPYGATYHKLAKEMDVPVKKLLILPITN